MSIKFAVIADPHYFSEKLGCEGKAYERRAGSDQKMLAPSRGCVLAAFEHIKKSGAQFLMIAGDLSNDGELCSHEEMRELLYEFKKTMPVYVITATHDWCCDGNPRRYEGDEIFHDVETIPPEKLHEFYKDFGPDESLSEFHTHQDKVSFVVRPCEGVTVFCLDDDQNGEGGSGYSDEHFKWITEQTAKAKKRGDVVFGMQHHHLHLTEFDRVINGKGSVEYREKLCNKFAEFLGKESLALIVWQFLIMQSLNIFLYNSFHSAGMSNPMNIAINFGINAALSLFLTWVSSKTITPLTNYLCRQMSALLWRKSK